MDSPLLADLNSRLAISGRIRFAVGPGGLPIARIVNPLAQATVALHGAHVLSFQPHRAAPVLWLSAKSQYADGLPIRGGIPVCWPWFGKHPTDAAAPGHGFARLQCWTVLATAALPDGATRLRLELRDTPATLAQWPHAFRLEADIVVGRTLTVALRCENPGTAPFTFTGALHSYFTVSDITKVAIEGLDGCTYVDTVGTPTRKVQSGAITIGAETDRIYVDTTATCVIADSGLGRRVRVAKRGSHTTVVWNPWIAKAARMPDFGDHEYLGMVCVETANAVDDVITVPPGGSHTLATEIGVD